MKLFKNKIVIGVICIIAGLLLSFVALPALQGSNQETYSNVVRMKETVQGGTQLNSDMVEVVKIPDDLIKGSINDIASVAGKYATTELYVGDYLTSEKLSSSPSNQNAFSAGTTKGKTVVSITLPSLASGVSGRLQPGDVVTVMALPKGAIDQSLGVEPDTSGSEMDLGVIIYPELEYVEVCMVTASDGSDSDVKSSLNDDENNNLPIAVSFFVDESQALRLVELEEQGRIHLAFVARGKDTAKYIPDSQRIFNTEVG